MNIPFFSGIELKCFINSLLLYNFRKSQYVCLLVLEFVFPLVANKKQNDCSFKNKMYKSIEITEYICFLCVKVKSRGQVVSAGKSSGVVTLIPEITWAPLACVIVYCVRPNGEIINDVMQIPITQTLKNQVIYPFTRFQFLCLIKKRTM